MMSPRLYKILVPTITVSVMVLAIAGFIIIGPHTIIEKFGAHSVYIGVFAFGLFAGLSSLIAGVFYATIITMAAGGLHPLLLAPVAGVALTCTNIVFIHVGTMAHAVIPERFSKRFHAFGTWMHHQRPWVIPLIIIGYMGLLPLPREILLLQLSAMRYPLRRSWLPILIGNMLFIFVITGVIRGIAILI